VPDAREGIFYNPDLDNLAIAYRRCAGGTTTDAYAQLESVASSLLAGAVPTAGTGRAGLDINVVGRVVSGRVIVEGVGTQVGGAGIGGRATVVLEGGQWRVSLQPEFMRRLAAAAGSNPNELQISLGGQLGPVSARVTGTNVLDPSRGVSFQLGWDFGPRVRREECYVCVCPGPTRDYTCIEDVLPRSEQVIEDVQVQRDQDLRYYFHLDDTRASEDRELQTASDTALRTAASLLRAGGSAVFIMGYASPEADERRHNADLSQRRAEFLRAQLAGQVGASVSLPDASGAGELLGRRPQPTPSSRLGDAIRPMGFRSAEDLTPFLLGEEIPRAELRAQFVSLFEALDTPADRLAVFGLTPDDPIAPRLLTAIDQFLRTRGGSRPWEQVFRRLRYAVIRVRRTVTEQQERTIEHSGSFDRLPPSACRPRSLEAERLGLFGPVDESLKRSTSSPSERDNQCPSGPNPDDVRKGCNYRIPSDAPRHAPRAPDVAPLEFGR
jgi:hypothetical protein